MNELDFKTVGFKAGLEIHQQLAGEKLFCHCPCGLREDNAHFSVERTLRASVGESGELDKAAAAEQAKQKLFVYEGYQDTTCLVELDEEPVSSPSHYAVETALIVSKMLGMTFVDTVHPMRKAVVDGSNTSGFQRTMLVSLQGKVGDVRVDRLCLEEDSAKIISRTAEQDTYNLSRLGIPLLEITTMPDIVSPNHLRDTAQHIGMILRSTRRVLRGLGTIRQDVNISVKGGARVEIKGVQDLDGMPFLAENEAKRQVSLIELADSLKKISVGAQYSTTKHFKKSEGWIASAIKEGKDVIGFAVRGWDGVLGKELFTDYRVGTELAGYAKARGLGGIIHSDEFPSKYGLSTWEKVRDAVGAKDKDGFVLVVGENDKAMDVLDLLVERIKLFPEGVQSEVRKANADGTTTYLRPMPGAARMYPETDVHQFVPNTKNIPVPELLTKYIERIKKEYDLSDGVATQLVHQDRAELFEVWAERLNPSLVAEILTAKEKEIRRRHQKEVSIDPILEELFERLAKQEISRDSVESIILEHADTGHVNWDSYSVASDEEIEQAVKDAFKEDKKAPFGALMGSVMKKLGGKADGKTVSEMIRKKMK